jgi:hypothetical protein
MLLVVVDQARVRRRGEHAVVATGELLIAYVRMDDSGFEPPGTNAGELLQSRQRVERIAAQEL